MEKITKKNIGINYLGKVKITVMKDGKEIKSLKVKNTGCIDLFKFLSNCLLGNLRQLDSPQYVMIYHLASGDPTPSNLGTPLLNTSSYKASQQQVVDENANESSARLRFLIPSNAFISNDTGNVISLINGDSDIMAYIKLTDEIDPTSLPVDSNLIIVWELNIANK